MVEWWVRLEGDDFDLSHLTTMLKTPLRCVRCEEGRYFLTADRFNHLTNATEVRTSAVEMVHTLNGLVRIRLNARRPITVGNMEQRTEDGATKNLYVMPESAPLWVREGVVGLVVTEGGIDKPIPQEEDPLVAWFALAESDQQVARVLSMYANVVQPWKDLTPIFEIIAWDVGGKDVLASKGWTSRNQITRFTRTSNHPEAAGEGARHGVREDEPPPNPMTEAEASEFVRSLMIQWLTFKQSQHTS
jgi:hypothetical protein